MMDDSELDELVNGLLTSKDARKLAEDSVWVLAKKELHLILGRIKDEAAKGLYAGAFVISYRLYPHIRCLLTKLGYSIDATSSGDREGEEVLHISWKG